MRKKLLFLASAVLTAAALTLPAPRAEAAPTCSLRCICGVIICTCSDGSECTIQPPYPPIPCIYINCDEGELLD